MGLRDLAVPQHFQARCGTFEQARHRHADRIGHQQAGRVALVLLGLRAAAGLAGQGVGHTGVERGAMLRAQGLGHQALQLGLECDHVQLLGGAVDLLHDGRRQVYADAPGQLGRVGDGGAELGHAFDDAAHVADVYALFQQELKHLLQAGNSDHFGDHILDQLGGLLGHVFDELLRLNAAQQAGGIHLHQV